MISWRPRTMTRARGLEAFEKHSVEVDLPPSMVGFSDAFFSIRIRARQSFRFATRVLGLT